MRRPQITFALAGILAGAAMATGCNPEEEASSPDELITRAEATNFLETSSYDEVVSILWNLSQTSTSMHFTTFGYSREGRALPLLVIGHVEDASPEAVRESGKTRVYLQGNIHAGEVAGKEALLMLAREMAGGENSHWLDSLVLLVGPIYNADGNERLDLNNRPRQHGPMGGMGTRPNAMGLDLNRDHMKLDAPESRSLTRFLTAYDPHVTVDLHVTNGTRHAYMLTYAPPLHPATPEPILDLVWDQWLPEVQTRIREVDGWDFYHYGNLGGGPDGEGPAWVTFDSRPRFGTNYAGLRNRVGILSEAYSYASFRDRVFSSLRFVEEVTSFAWAHATEIRDVTEAQDAEDLVGTLLPTRTRYLATPGEVEILMGDVTEQRHPYTGEVILLRTDARVPTPMREFIRFEAAEEETVPAAYLLPPELGDVVERLRAHGIRTEVLERDETTAVEAFRISERVVAEQPFQNRTEQELQGRYELSDVTLPAGTVRVDVRQPLGRLAFMLLEPRSHDGFANWGLLATELGAGDLYPIFRVP